MSNIAQLAGSEDDARAGASSGLEREPEARSALSVFDRLTDDDPSELRDCERKRVGSARELLHSVVRDLSALLNSVRIHRTDDWVDYPRVATSVLNYGLPDLTGRTRTSIDVLAWQVQLRRALLDFEPRLVPETVRVLVPEADVNSLAINSLRFTIEAALWCRPAPLWMCLHSEIDLETGAVHIQGGRG